MTLPLFAPKAGGGWYLPTKETPPGVYVEQCRLFERCQRLEVDDLDPLMEAWRRCQAIGWTGIGFEAGRGFERVSFRAHVGDMGIMDPKNWFIGQGGARFRLGGWIFREPDQEPVLFPPSLAEERALRLRPWAVEFPKADRGDGKPGFVRRRFWFASRYRVPDFSAESKARHLAHDQAIARRRRAQRYGKPVDAAVNGTREGAA